MEISCKFLAEVCDSGYIIICVVCGGWQSGDKTNMLIENHPEGKETSEHTTAIILMKH